MATLGTGTLGHGIKLLEVVRDKARSEKHLQRVIGSGLVSDVFEADLSRVERDVVRQALKLEPLQAKSEAPVLRVSEPMIEVEVNYDLRIEKVLVQAKKVGQLAWANENITRARFEPTRMGKRSVPVRLASFGRQIPEFERRRRLYAEGLIDLGAIELAAVNEKFPSGPPLEAALPIAACEKFWLDDDGGWSFPDLDRSADGRRVGLDWTYGLHGLWSNHWSFLVASVEEYLAP